MAIGPVPVSEVGDCYDAGSTPGSTDFRVDFRLLAEDIPHIVWAAGPDGSIEYFNQRGAAFTGLPPKAIYGSGWLSLIHQDDAERAQADWDRAQETRSLMDVQWRARRADGEYRRMAIRAVPVFGPSGDLVQWVGTCTDIEEEERLNDHLMEAEKAAAESLTLLETLLSTAPVGFGYVDLDFRIVRINDTLAKVTGMTVEKHVGLTVAEVVPDLWSQLEPVYRTLMETGEPVVNEEIVGRSASDPDQVRYWLSSF